MLSTSLQSIGQLKPKGVEAHFIVAACENMVSEKAMRPGDILTASNGKTIEVRVKPALSKGYLCVERFDLARIASRRL